ncbi:nicotinate-nucleotide--dimethylbenzimidazole phosphoribosyltransferase [Corynebacterium yudongzhengii]|uniref:Nicotinate-nucleotide--dimethylbenzimidazole phosphoribosyltransferase n=1 Tax=Corynebacterium yudongzhengii TaxID=2080740 RepID=A0A2U1T7C5_9CORY|nr:nicotinate-nucleotide--dimethylbenzimidazole phosphoribosyltransferase [Corynebacterium yudongzhengii]PWC01892.1 nicotinate-nucleotide--dimethylbenzimidazole phosphoribosyltransferase [Corynebacterium yudongzhengii]
MRRGGVSSVSTPSPNAGLLVDDIAPPDHRSSDRLAAALASTPRGVSFGRLATIAAQVAGWQARTVPEAFHKPRVVVFAGDHGISERGISAYAPQASVEQADEIASGAGPVHTMARTAGASVRLVDVSLDHEAWGEERVSRSTPPIDVADAMDQDQFARSLAIGRRIADHEIDAGADLLIPGELGVGSTAVAAAVVGTLTATEPVAIVGPGSGVPDEIWKRKVSVIRDAMFRARGLRRDLSGLLTAISAPDFVAMTAFIAHAAARRTPVLLDGAAVTAAALVANRLAPGAADWFAAGQLSPKPAHVIALQELGLTPLVALDMSTGQATGSLAALPLIQAAIELASDEAQAAGVDN